MADVRALLKAKREEVKVTHPLAAYNKNNQLRCTACGTLVKYASAWEGHLGSKAHRTTVARLRNEEKAREAQRLQQEAEEAQRLQMVQGKRKAEEDDVDEDMEEGDTKRRRVGDATKTNPFPTDFFSDPSRAMPTAGEESGEEEDVAMNPPPLPPPPSSEIDLEYERFQREMRLDAPDERETYERATVFAEAELVVEQVSDGFPAAQGEEAQSDLQQKVSEEEARRKKEQEERELIMDRLLDEERAQEEADMRVTALKSRLDALRKKREAARFAKAKTTS